MNTKEQSRIMVNDRVRYHPVIGGPHDKKVYIVRAVGKLHRQNVVWLAGKPGCVAIESVTRI